MTLRGFVPARVDVDVAAMLRFHGYRDRALVAPPIVEAAAEMARVAGKLAAPRVVFQERNVERVDPGQLTLDGGVPFHGTCFHAHLADAHRVIVFLATLGPDLDARAEVLADGEELLEALFLETAGWLMLEDALRQFRRHLAANARARGCRLSPRLGPGYLDWPLDEQRALFALFDGQPVPVDLNAYCVMMPKKSISGLFGLRRASLEVRRCGT
jgi:hypothetical protein